MLENIKPAKYTHRKLMDDVMETALKTLASASDNFCFSMKCNLEGSFEQLELITNDDVKLMFEKNKTYMEVELY